MITQHLIKRGKACVVVVMTWLQHNDAPFFLTENRLDIKKTALPKERWFFPYKEPETKKVPSANTCK